MTTAHYPSLKGSRVFITGGASGIGASMVSAYRAQGAHVGFIDWDEPAASAFLGSLDDGAGPTPTYFSGDVGEADVVRDALTAFAGADGLDVLVSNAADDTRHDPLATDATLWRRALATNLDGAFYSIQGAIPHFRRRGQGAVILMSSINALFGPPDMPAYVAAKSALLGLTKSLATQYGPENVRMNAILPGWVVTERQLRLWLTPEEEAEWSKHVALKDRLLPEHVADLALFLGSSASQMITGQHFVIDAGRT